MQAALCFLSWCISRKLGLQLHSDMGCSCLKVAAYQAIPQHCPLGFPILTQLPANALGRQCVLAQVFWLLSPIWETSREFWVLILYPSSLCCASLLGSETADKRSFSFTPLFKQKFLKFLKKKKTHTTKTTSHQERKSANLGGPKPQGSAFGFSWFPCL